MRQALNLVLLAWLIVATGVSCSKTTHDSPGTGAVSQTGNGKDSDSHSLHVAVVTGGHAFDVPNFYRLFRQLPDVDAYPQHIEHFASSPQEVRDSYDAIVFYGMDQGVPEEKGRRASGNPKAAIERLVDQGQGIVVLHHALLAWEKWEFWNQLIGFDNRNFRYKEGLQLEIEVGDKSHEITQGMSDFTIIDEGYVLHGKYDGQGTVLLTTDHDDSMAQVAWARQHGKSRVFCMALGHDKLAWNNEGFRDILCRGIAWSAGGVTESNGE
jgi:type 1 glutamine amidotransferase